MLSRTILSVSALALLMPLAVQPVLASLADRDRRFTSRRLAMALTGLLLLCAVGLWCSAGSMAVTAALYVLVGISLTATAPFHSAMAMELQQHGVALNYGLSRGLGSACYAADDQTVKKTGTCKAGVVVDVDTRGVWVRVGV